MLTKIGERVRGPVQIQQINASDESLVSNHRCLRRQMKLILFLLSVAFSAVLYISFDYFYSAAIRRTSHSFVNVSSCRIRDAVRDHALQPNCAFIDYWGRNSYEFFTNSLGFRDEKIRQVPLADVRPRILILGDSFTEGKIAWDDSYVGRIAAHFPQYDFLNGGVSGYSPSNYLNVVRMVLDKNVDIDEVIIFVDISSVQNEAAVYMDAAASGAVTVRRQQRRNISWYGQLRSRIASHLFLTNDIVEFFERLLVGHGYYHVTRDWYGDRFDTERSAWTYRKVNETDPYPAGYAPLGVEGGIAKEQAKMTLLWQELEKRNIPMTVVVYPWPAQVVHDQIDSRQVRIWRDWCEGKCKRFVSLFPAFFAAKNECPWTQRGCWYLSLFLFGDHHYNTAGNTLIADEVIKSLKQYPPIKRRPTVRISPV